MAELTMTDRMRAATLLHALLDDADRFDPTLARELIEIVPTQPKKGASVQVTLFGQEESTLGQTPELGNVQMDGAQEENHLIDYNRYPEHRIGTFKVRHFSGRMFITGLWDGTEGGYDAKASILYITPLHDNAICMTQPAGYESGDGFNIHFADRLWKLPINVETLAPDLEKRLRNISPETILRKLGIRAVAAVLFLSLAVQCLWALLSKI